jgi:hypothetical protein
MVFVTRHGVTGVDLPGLASLSPPGSAFIPADGIQGRPAYQTSTQIGNREGISMSPEQSMSTGQPDQESM